MDCTVRDKHIRAKRRTRPAKVDPNHSTTSNNTNGDVENSGSGKTRTNTDNYHRALKAMADSGWVYCTEEQLEVILLKKLEFLYNEAIKKLVALGYDEEVVLKAILRNMHCYGGMDILTNIMHNSLAYLNSGGSNGGSDEKPGPSFVDLRKLEEFSLSAMVALLQQVKPHLSKGDAMWCLVMSNLHVGRASVMEFPISSSSGNGNVNGVESAPESGGPICVSPALYRFHGGWGFGNGGLSQIPMNGKDGFLSYASKMALQKDIECPKRFNLTPSMKQLLERNVAMFAAGIRANSKQFQSQSQSQACPSSFSGGDSSTPIVQREESHNVKTQDVVNSVMSKFKNMNLDENSEPVSLDKKDKMILSLVHQLQDLEEHVKERKEWAHQKAIQAARKLSHDLNELKTRRMDREEIQRLKKGNQIYEDKLDNTMKKLSEMDNAFREVSGQVDRANSVAKKFENENAEIRAEMEASKLSASESVTIALEVAQREKKCHKRILACEKQKSKIQEEIVSEKQRIAELQRELDEVESATKDTEAKWRQEQSAKELALEQLEEERCFKEASEGNNKRNLETLLLKVKIDSHRHKDDLQRLEQEYIRLKKSAQSNELDHQPNEILAKNSKNLNPQGETVARLLHELDQFEDSSEKEGGSDRECMICKKDEVSVVFLPCAHQVICGNCNDNYGKKKKKGKATCCYCRAPIEQRVRVFGASS